MSRGNRQRDPNTRPRSGGRMRPAGTLFATPTHPGRLLRRRPVLRFMLVFTTLAATFYAVIFFLPFCRTQLYPACWRSTARVTGAVLAVLGQDITVAGTSVLSSAFSVNIVRGCDAVEPVALFVCAVLAFPSPILRKIPGIVLGWLCLAILNCVRIVSLFLIGTYWPRLFHVIHVDVWQSVFILLAMMLWILWLLWATQGQTPAQATSG